MKHKPKWKHDCERCEFVGRVNVDGEERDIYVCIGNFGIEIVGRWGDNGPEYGSYGTRSLDSNVGGTMPLWWVRSLGIIVERFATRKKRTDRTKIGAAVESLVSTLPFGVEERTAKALDVCVLGLERLGDEASAERLRARAATLRSKAVNIAQRAVPTESSIPEVEREDLLLNAPEAAKFDELLVQLGHVEEFVAAGIDAPTRILFTGPPGTGKTLAASVLAKHLGVQLAVVRYGKTVGSHMGETGAAIARLFEEARKVPTVVFLDEADAIGNARSSKSDAADAENNRITLTLMQELDRAPQDLIVIAATNRPDALDPALQRRFSVQLDFPMPAIAIRKRMLRHWLKNAPVSEIEIDQLAQPDGCTGAELRLAAMLVARARIVDLRATRPRPAEAQGAQGGSA